MAILGAALRAELVEAMGLGALRRDLRREIRALARELKAVQTVLNGVIVSNGRLAKTERQDQPIAASDIRAARQRLGDSRKAFAQRLGVSQGIVFAWESGRSVPRRKAIVGRLQGLLAQHAMAKSHRSGSEAKRVLKLSSKRRAALKRQGQYMGYLRTLRASQKAEVKRVKASSGLPAAIKLARQLRQRSSGSRGQGRRGNAGKAQA